MEFFLWTVVVGMVLVIASIVFFVWIFISGAKSLIKKGGSQVLNELVVNAVFTGNDGSVGFRRGLNYNLRLLRLRGNSFLALSIGFEQGLYCEYESVFSFLSNWTEVKVQR